jgi:hypothetical protein
MKRWLPLACCLLLLGGNAFALKVYDIDLPETATVSGQLLQLNGYGLRKKIFFKVYLGSLYTGQPATTTEQVLEQPGAKLVRMDFIYSKVEREKITNAFADGFENNSPELAGQPSVKQFLALFNADFKAGDRVDLEITTSGVSARHNTRELGTIESPELARGVLLIYLGKEPADKSMKNGLLGRK